MRETRGDGSRQTDREKDVSEILVANATRERERVVGASEMIDSSKDAPNLFNGESYYI